MIAVVTLLSSTAACVASEGAAEKGKEITMADQSSDLQASLRMAEPSEIAGPRLVIGVNVRCGIRLTLDRIESANGWRVTDSEGCLATLLPGAIAWRPAPDGIDLAGADGLTVVHFDAEGKGQAPSGAALTLTRAK